MRPIVSEQNSLRFPLNEILGTQAQIRLIPSHGNRGGRPCERLRCCHSCWTDTVMCSKSIRETLQRLSRFFTSTSERANRLCQSDPFFAVLTPEDQARLVQGLEDKNDTGSA